MPGTEANIGVDIPPTVDQRLDARRVTQTTSGFAVDREAVIVADPVSTDEIARVTSTDGLDVDVTRLPAGTVAGAASIPAGTNNIGDVDVLTQPARSHVTDSIRLGDGTDLALVTAAGALVIDGSGVTHPVSAASLPLPTGAATAAAQLPNSHDVTVDNAAGAAAVNVQDGGNILTVDGTVDIGTFPDNEPFNLNQVAGTALAAPFDLDTGAGTQSIVGVSVRKAASGGSVEYGTATDPLRVDPTGTTTQPMSAASLPLPTGAATAAAQLPNSHDVTVDNAAGASAVNIQDGGNSLTIDGTTTANQGTAGTAWEMIGDVAHDAVAPANPLIMGAQMETMADSAPGTRASTDGDATTHATLDGAQYVIPTGPQVWSYHENSSAALTDAVVHAAPGAGLSLYITDIIFSTGAATAWNILLEEGAATILGPWYLEAVAGRGANLHFATPKKVTANTAVTVTTSAAILHSIDITGFVAPG